MLNADVGSECDFNGATCVLTRKGARGHAVFGPYVELEPGDYIVEFTLFPAGGAAEPDAVCATLDVTRDEGKDMLARRDIRYSDLAGGAAHFTLSFAVPEASRVEYRVEVTGIVPLLVQEHRPIVRLPEGADDPAALIAAARFPSSEVPLPAFFGAPFLDRGSSRIIDHRQRLRRFHEQGVAVSVADGEAVLRVQGVSFHARCVDDLNFINEIFFESAYNFVCPRDCCVIDIGMNIALASLLFATRDGVQEIHAFEPFPETFGRALANIALNPALAAKITPYNHGISDRDEDSIFTVFDRGDSGEMATRSVEGGRPVRLITRDAATALRPIIAAARAKGRDVVMKVDCEGAEFAIFKSLDEAGLLGEVTAFMVEWHRVFEGRTQAELIGPLKRAGFVAFDLTRETGNGFFYAARTA